MLFIYMALLIFQGLIQAIVSIAVSEVPAVVARIRIAQFTSALKKAEYTFPVFCKLFS